MCVENTFFFKVLLRNYSAQNFSTWKEFKAIPCSLLTRDSILACISEYMSPVVILLFIFFMLCPCTLSMVNFLF